MPISHNPYNSELFIDINLTLLFIKLIFIEIGNPILRVDSRSVRPQTGLTFQLFVHKRLFFVHNYVHIA